MDMGKKPTKQEEYDGWESVYKLIKAMGAGLVFNYRDEEEEDESEDMPDLREHDEDDLEM